MSQLLAAVSNEVKTTHEDKKTLTLSFEYSKKTCEKGEKDGFSFDHIRCIAL